MSYVQERLAQISETQAITGTSLPHVVAQKTRTGQTVLYYRKGKGKRIRLPNPRVVGDAGFRQAYNAAANGIEPKKKPAPKCAVTQMPIGSPGYTYFIRAGYRVKIGFTRSVKERMQSLQTASGESLELLMVIPGAQGTETFFHERFADNRVSGEWFALIGTLADFVGYKPARS